VFLVAVTPSNEIPCVFIHCRCHTLKYLILGCECLLQYVHLSIGFSENFKDFSSNYSIYLRARSIFLFGKL
jgi:hypothetical protein